MLFSIWYKCLNKLQNELSNNDFNKWIRPLQADINNNIITLYAPNKFVLEKVKNKFLKKINSLLIIFCNSNLPIIKCEIGSKPLKISILKSKTYNNSSKIVSKMIITSSAWLNKINYNNVSLIKNIYYKSNINIKYNFENFIEGKSNQLAKSIALQVSYNLGELYNPLFLYGDTGLGKTHLLHAIYNSILLYKNHVKVIYMNSEKFVQNMVKALQENTIEKFKYYYRSVDVLLIDDIQFFSNKERSQEELFHIFNSLIDGHQQIILTSDKSPKKINGLENRLKSRFECGLSVEITSPEIETRIKILIKKANENKIKLSYEVAYFIAKHFYSNVRELEGIINRIVANYNFFNKEITINYIRKEIKNFLFIKKKNITLSDIQKTVAKYYKIKIKDLISKKRFRSVSIPRQIAMALSKKLTNCSLLEIGYYFGGRDHTTVLYACRKINKLYKKNLDIKETFSNLIKILSY